MPLSAIDGPAIDGRYVLAEPIEVVEARRVEAVERSVAALPGWIRPFARPLVDRAAHGCARWALSLDPVEVHVACDADGALIAYRGGERVVDGPDGRRYTIGVEVTDEDVVVSWTGAAGSLRTTYHPDALGLDVTREVSSARLPEPVVWTARYRRE
ncbi:MAG: hypothetical protein ABMB14_15980 [Myxococcota bacterium]